MVTVSHQRHFIQHLKGGSRVATIVCFDLEVVWRHQGTWQVTRIVAALLAYLKASATAELQLLQLLSDLLLIFFPWRRAPASPAGHPHTPSHLKGCWESTHVPLHPCGLWLVFMVLFCLFLPHFMSIYLSWPCRHYFRPQHQIPKKLSYTDYRTSIQNYQLPVIYPWFQITFSGSTFLVKPWLVLTDPRKQIAREDLSRR